MGLEKCILKKRNLIFKPEKCSEEVRKGGKTVERRAFVFQRV